MSNALRTDDTTSAKQTRFTPMGCYPNMPAIQQVKDLLAAGHCLTDIFAVFTAKDNDFGVELSAVSTDKTALYSDISLEKFSSDVEDSELCKLIAVVDNRYIFKSLDFEFEEYEVVDASC